MKRIYLTTDLAADHTDLYAVGLRLAYESNAELKVLHLHDEEKSANWKSLPTVREMLVGWGVLAEDASLEEFEALGLQVQPVNKARKGSTFQDLMTRIHEAKPDLLIMGSEARIGLQRLLNPSVAQSVARYWSGPTLLLHHESKSLLAEDGCFNLTKVLIPVDSSTNQQPAIDATERLLLAMGMERVELTLLHMGEEQGVPVVERPAQPHWNWHSVTRTGGVVGGINDVAREIGAELIVMGTQGHNSWLDSLQGSTTERVFRRAPCAVLVVPLKQG